MTAPHVQEYGPGHSTDLKAESDWRGDLEYLVALLDPSGPGR
jgi:hypothetical protein